MYKFLIYISYPYSIPIGAPIQKEIERQGHQIYWFSDLEETKRYFKNNEPVLNSVQEVMTYKPDIVLTATDVVPDFFPGIKVQIFHGFLSNKREEMKSHFRIRGFFDLYLTQGPSTTSVFKELSQKLGFFEVVETGWSKVDPLFPIENRKQNHKPVIMISSTFTTRLSLALNDDVFNEIKRMVQSGKYRFICVLHPKLDQATKDKFESLNGENFQYYDTTDLVPLFKQADIMLSDTTSAIVEFLLQKKPVVTFRTNKIMSHLINVTETVDLEKNIDHALSYPDDLLLEIEQYVKITHPYSDGKSSERIVKAALDFLNKDRSYLKNKPFNFLRKWKIRKHFKMYYFQKYF
ncbi:UDP-N-acetylglucosamine 2-epimerase [Flavobacterium sp. ARAG 55.4]|uniref:UDP-N-acetylglucosamine 2-epimerase n=1 Tax=Flavobacterium plantiphilum TaxID=3163297 RepID=A0ABW8XTZ6_9FLAO